MVFTLQNPDPKTPVTLTPSEESHLVHLRDDDIDYSDIPEADVAFWAKAVSVAPDTTLPVTLRVKQSVLTHFKRQGKKGYQSRMNAVLESYVRAQQGSES